MRTKLDQMSVRQAMIEIAGKPGFGEQPRWLKKVADGANISKRAARDLWRGYIQNEDHKAVRAVKRAADLIEARRELAAQADRYRSIIGGMRAQDPDFYSSEIDRLERLLDRIGAVDRS